MQERQSPHTRSYRAGAVRAARCGVPLLAAVWLAIFALAAGAGPLSEAEHPQWRAIGRVNVGGFNTRSACTGTLIAPDLVLTAAHCVPARATREEAPEQVHFLAGWYRGDYAAHRTARAIFVHPDYVRDRRGVGHLYSDIALIELESPIAAEEATPLPLRPMPNFADDIDIVAYGNPRPNLLERSGPCVGIALNDDLLGLTCRVRGGNSGAPVLRRGEDGWGLVAVAVARNTGDGGFRSFAARASDALFERAGREMP